MNKYLLHVMIYIVSIISYIYLNDVNIAPLTMCSVFIKLICCNRSLKDTDMVSDPANISVPFEDVKKVGQSIEDVVDEIISPKNKVKKMVSWWDEKKKD